MAVLRCRLRVDYRQDRFDNGRGGQRGVRLPFVFRRPVLVVRYAPDHRVRMTVVAHQRPHDRVEFRVHGQQLVLGGELLPLELAGHGALTAADRTHVYPRASETKRTACRGLVQARPRTIKILGFIIHGRNGRIWNSRCYRSCIVRRL